MTRSKGEKECLALKTKKKKKRKNPKNEKQKPSFIPSFRITEKLQIVQKVLIYPSSKFTHLNILHNDQNQETGTLVQYY